MQADAIVNAANERMLGGGGVDGAIHRAAGPELREACVRVPMVKDAVRCPTGEARVTPGFRLPAKHVIHTAGPVWQGGDAEEERLLALCYTNSLAAARGVGAKTVAFPAISCGVYGFPIDRAAEIAVSSIRQATRDDHFEHIYLVAFDRETSAALREALRFNARAN